MDEYRYHDEYPARGDWPGGKRYGYTVQRGLMPRTWSDSDLERAHGLGITLPTMDLETYESWYDQSAPVITEVVTDGLPDSYSLQRSGSSWLDYTGTFSQRTVMARRYAFRSWAYQPPWVPDA